MGDFSFRKKPVRSGDRWAPPVHRDRGPGPYPDSPTPRVGRVSTVVCTKYNELYEGLDK